MRITDNEQIVLVFFSCNRSKKPKSIGAQILALINNYMLISSFNI